MNGRRAVSTSKDRDSHTPPGGEKQTIEEEMTMLDVAEVDHWEDLPGAPKGGHIRLGVTIIQHKGPMPQRPFKVVFVEWRKKGRLRARWSPVFRIEETQEGSKK